MSVYHDAPRLYRKKPVVIEAMQFTDNVSALAIESWAGTKTVEMIVDEELGMVIGLLIDTLEGKMLAGMYDYIIRGIANEFYPCKPQIFEVTYESVTANDYQR